MRTRPTLTVPRILGTVAAAVLLSACGASSSGTSGGTVTQNPGGSVTTGSDPSQSPSTGTSTGTSSPASTAAADRSTGTDLTIVADDGAGTRTTWRLVCEPTGGNHPDPAGACAALARAGRTALPPVPADRVCTMIYGGPQTATVTGTWRGAPVSSTFKRTNGCEIGRWTALVPLLPEPKAT